MKALGDYGAQEVTGLNSVLLGSHIRLMWVSGAGFFLK